MAPLRTKVAQSPEPPPERVPNESPPIGESPAHKERTRALNARTVDAIAPTSKRLEYPDGEVPGLFLRVIARRHLVSISKGIDPAAGKVSRTEKTIRDLAADYIERHAKPHKKSWQADDSSLEANVLPYWKHLPIRAIRRQDVRELVMAVKDRGAPIMANRVLALVRKMFNHAVRIGWLDANPAALLEKPAAERSRTRLLTDEEIRLVWSLCELERVTMAVLIKLRLLTIQRGGELVQLQWTDVEDDAFTLRSEVTKNKIAFRVPQTKTSRALFARLPRVEKCPWVFPGRFEDKPMTDLKKAGQRLQDRIAAVLKERGEEVTTVNLRGHDLRRTGATRMRKAKVPREDVSRLLHHIEGGPKATRVYDLYEGEDEKRAALEVWEDLLLRIVTDDSRR
jgi:integrase